MTGNPPVFPRGDAERLVEAALDEDLGRDGDLTSQAVVGRDETLEAVVEAREDLVVCGLPVAELVLEHVVRRGLGEARMRALTSDGQRAPAGTALAVMQGAAWSILAAERLQLNLVGRLSGIASLTAACVAEVEGTGARIADTRKTTPGLRALEKYAVASGGGENHRRGLDDGILVKDNHKRAAGGIDGVVRRLKAAGVDLSRAELEVETLEEARIAADAGAGWILLDNMAVDTIREAVQLIGGRANVEVSGGLRPGNLRPYAEAGPQRLSLGVLTHGARSADVALEWRETAPHRSERLG